MEAVGLSGPVVLVVEDEGVVRLDLATELRRKGFHILEAGTAEDGLGTFRAHSGIRAAVVDIGLPGAMNGYDLVEAMRAERPGMLVVLMSGSEFAMPPGFDEHVIIERKPCDPGKIALILQPLTARSTEVV